jgi:hypothetical protein
MRKLLAIGVLAALGLAVIGCDPGTVSQGDQEAMRKEMSQEAYEEAMRKAGRGAELDAQKAQDAARRAEEGGQ